MGSRRRDWKLGENLAGGRSNSPLYQENNFNNSEGDCDVIQAYISLDMESMLQEWRRVSHRILVVSKFGSVFCC